MVVEITGDLLEVTIKEPRAVQREKRNFLKHPARSYADIGLTCASK